MIPTRSPLKSTLSWGQRPVWNVLPANDSIPSNFGVFVEDKQPVAMMQNFADSRSPRSVAINQRFAASSKTAEVTRVSSRM